jgi:hypothetical protein
VTGIARAAAALTAAAIAASTLAGCTSAARSDRAAAHASSGGLEVPADPYGPFPYASGAQRHAFSAYLACAAALGVDMEGPYADSDGNGALLRLAPGAAHPSAKKRAEVMRQCPQAVVALALTPGPVGREHAFEQALLRFAKCLVSHGLSDLAKPAFGAPDPYLGLRWPLAWDAEQTVDAARQCIDPLRQFALGA